MRLGVITGIDRTNRLVGAQMDDGLTLALPRGFPYRGDPPPPLTLCAFSDLGGGQLVCEGPLGERRTILHDDFTIVGAAPAFGDTNWRLGAGTAPAALSVADTQGVQGMLTTNVLNNYTLVVKSDNSCFPPTPPAGLWFSARVAVGTAANATITTMLARWGLLDDAGQDGMIFMFDTAGAVTTWQMQSWLAGAITSVATAQTVVSQTWVYLDLVLVAGVGVGGWVDGNGPYGSGTNIPTTAVAFDPFLQVLTRAASVRAVQTDWVHLEYVSEVLDPTGLSLAVMAERTDGPRYAF